MDSRRVNELLERVRDVLGYSGDPDVGTQKKPSQKNKASTAAAKKKLGALKAMSKSGRSKGNKLDPKGAKPSK